MKKIALLSAFIFAIATCFAQRGKNGNLTVTTTVTVNEYTTLTADASTGNTSITVANSGLNTKARFAGNLATGDLVMIIQMQGATINGQPEPSWDGPPSIGLPKDSSWGAVTNYNNCGNYEFAQVSSVPNATTIQFDCGLTNNYTAAGRVQVIRVPRYNTLTVNSGGSIVCDTWDSAKGGIVSIEVLGNTIVNTGGTISSFGSGFRGASLDSNGATYGVNNFAVNGTLYLWGKSKGEGIAGYEWMLDQFGGRNCRGADANGGGGGNAHNGGGGGGANGGAVASWVDGIGVPDITTTNNKNAWKLEYSWLPTFVGSGGGRGGYTFSSSKQDPTTTAPGNGAWSGDKRSSEGGLGGRPLDYSTGKIFMGGGGGAGDQDDNFGGVGGNGGGIVYITSYGTVSGGGQIAANGANGANSAGTPASNSYSGKDGAGGAGGGGAVIINSAGNISGISVQANGGTGGNQVMTKGAVFFGTINEAEGPGGGGGGGYIATSNPGVTESAAGGANGTTTSPVMTKFPPNGATSGGVGTTNAAITNFQIVAQNDTFCSGFSPTLMANLTGTVPAGTTVEWYTSSAGGSPFATGNSYTTGPLTKDTVLYIGTCPGTYRQAINIIIGGGSSVTISAPTTICSGATTNLSTSGGTAYSWAPAGSLNNASIANPIASPTVTTTYTVNITTPCGPKKDSVVITVTPGLTITATATSPTICSGNSTNITASGGTTYSWTPATGLNATTGSVVTADPATTETYSVTGTTAGCSVTQTVVLTVNTTPTVTASATSPTICAGGSTTLNASGATAYSWSPNNALSSTSGSSVTASPSATITYSVTGVSSGCTSSVQTVAVNVNAKPSVTVTPPSPGICSGGSVNLVASGANTYSWSPATGLSNTSGSNVTASPVSTLTYTIIGTSIAGCTDTTKVIVTVGASLTASITGKDTVCPGNSTVLTASGGSAYTWSNASTNASINVSPATTTTYSVLVSSGTCKDSAKVTVTVSPAITAGITGANSICTGGSTTLTASGGSSYTWSGGTTSTSASITVSPVTTTTYSLQVSNGTCTKDTSVVVMVDVVPKPTISGPQTTCAGVAVNLNATGGLTYSWSPPGGLSSSTIQSPVANPASTTIYTVTVSNGPCTAKDSVKVTVNPAATGVACCSATITSGQSTTLGITSTSAGETYSWLPVTGLSCNTCPNPVAKPTVTTTYYVTITDTDGCNKEDSLTITVNENCGAVFVPEAFSPNGDGQNDVLYVRGDCIQSMDFNVFDRWGNKVFESHSISDGWDGKYNGQPMNSGSYVYYLTATDIYNKAYSQKGNVALVR